MQSPHQLYSNVDYFRPLEWDWELSGFFPTGLLMVFGFVFLTADETILILAVAGVFLLAINHHTAKPSEIKLKF